MSDWTGSPVTLKPNDNRNMPQTSDGSMILLYLNLSKGNSVGTLNVSSGGDRPDTVNVPAGTNQPSIMVRNWHGNNLSVTNQSKTDVDIYVAAYGPALNPKNCTEFAGSAGHPLTTMSCITGNASPQWMTLRFQATSNNETIFALIGGPVSDDGINAYVFGLNATSNSGPPAGTSPPPPKDGYFQRTTKNTIDFQFNWGSSRIWVVNLSAATAAAGQVFLLNG